MLFDSVGLIHAEGGSDLRMKLLVFAHVPPPHHGQSQMVKWMVDGFRSDPSLGLEVIHVDARLSSGMDDVGSIRGGKLRALWGYCREALSAARGQDRPTLYYIPSPPKRASLYRDWIVMALIRWRFHRVILHWHAVGLGAWLESEAWTVERWLTQLFLGRADRALVLAESNRADAEVLRPRSVAVVSNGDVANTYMKLIPSRHRKKNTDRKMKGMAYSMSLFVIYFGTDKKYDDIAHHEIIMGPRYRGLLEDIFTKKTLSDDFSLYLHRPTATDPSLAPEGCDSWYVLSPVPNLAGDVDWEAKAQEYRDRIVAYLEERYMPGLSKHIVTERRVDPRYFRDVMSSHLGSAFSVEPTLMQSAWMRPHNVSEDIPNLYFAGAGTHPGAGLPGVISSGKIVADLIGGAT